MEYELPLGCNILANDGTLYNYSSDLKTRTTYILHEGQLFKSAVSHSNTAYSVTGDCISSLPFDSVNSDVYFPIVAFVIAFAIFWFCFNLVVKRLLP